MTPKILLVLTGKTASGKDTVMAKLLEKFPGFKRVITTTSRKIRDNEKNNADYNFISEPDFRQKIKDNNFIEYVEYGGNLYGTEKGKLISDYNLIWRIDPSRAGRIRELIKDKKLLVIYLTADDETVGKRLKKRGLSRQDIERRMREDAAVWQKYKDNYDFVVENIPGHLDQTIDKICKIILAF